MLNILIAIPTFENVSLETFKSIYNLDIPAGYNANFDFIKGYDCARARNAIIKKGLSASDPSNIYHYILMVDSDVILPKDALQNLLSDDVDIVLGYYPRKNEPSISEIFHLSNDGYPSTNKLSIDYIKAQESKGIYRLPINGGGFGCALIKTSLLRQLDYPYFNYVNYADGNFLSEDLYFCSKVRNRGGIVFLDTRVGCGHVGKKIIDC